MESCYPHRNRYQMKPFFTAKQVKSDITLTPQSCASCGLYKDCENPRMSPKGKFRKKVMIIGEYPVEWEDAENRLWNRRIGRFFKKTLADMGLDVHRDCLSLNAVNCRPMDKVDITPNHVYCCRKRVFKTIKQYQPKVIILLGKLPIESIIGSVVPRNLGGTFKWRGWCIPDRKFNAWICPTFHPIYVSRLKDEKNQLPFTIWKQDLARILKHIDKPLPTKTNEESCIQYLWTAKDLIKVLPDLINAPLLSFDYEGTGLKPHRDAQKIVSVSAVTKNGAFGWMNNPVMAKIFRKVLLSKVPKTAHNLQFENAWSYFKMNARVNNWKWCSMNAAHVLDNRKGVTGLKFQTYANFGVGDYDSHINPFLKSPAGAGNNALNRIEDYVREYGEESLLKYNVLDSIFGYNLTVTQMRSIYGEERIPLLDL